MIALDLDNTIICYDEAFRTAATRLDCLPQGVASINKSSIKAAAFAKGGNELWTRLQGLAYGEEISKARLFPGCAEFMKSAPEDCVILSHKTRLPVLGPHTDLRAAAATWLGSTPLAKLPLHFFDTREAKVAALATMKPRALLDDLPEVFHTPGFPPETTFVLFDPNNAHPHWHSSPRIPSWRDAHEQLWPSSK